MRKALAIGIDDYPNAPLSGCVNDAEAVAGMLARNGNGSKNFDVMTERNAPTKGKVKSLVKDCFAGDAEIALLYFSGHGVFTSLLVEALSGAAADVTGHITPGGIYAYIDKAPGA